MQDAATQGVAAINQSNPRTTRVNMAMPTSTPSAKRTMRRRLGVRGLSVTDLSITASPGVLIVWSFPRG
jgi:hypothetical protein